MRIFFFLRLNSADVRQIQKNTVTQIIRWGNNHKYKQMYYDADQACEHNKRMDAKKWKNVNKIKSSYLVHPYNDTMISNDQPIEKDLK